MEQWERPGWRDGFQMPGRPDSTAPVPVNPFPAMRPDGGSYHDTYPTPTPSFRPQECGRDRPWPVRRDTCFASCAMWYGYKSIETGRIRNGGQEVALPRELSLPLLGELPPQHSKEYCRQLRELIDLSLKALGGRRDFYNCMTACLGIQPALPNGVYGPDSATPEEREWERGHSQQIYERLRSVHELIWKYERLCNQPVRIPPGSNPQWRAN